MRTCIEIIKNEIFLIREVLFSNKKCIFSVHFSLGEILYEIYTINLSLYSQIANSNFDVAKRLQNVSVKVWRAEEYADCDIIS